MDHGVKSVKLENRRYPCPINGNQLLINQMLTVFSASNAVQSKKENYSWSETKKESQLI